MLWRQVHSTKLLALLRDIKVDVQANSPVIVNNQKQKLFLKQKIEMNTTNFRLSFSHQKNVSKV